MEPAPNIILVIEGKSGKGNLGLSDLSLVISAAVSLWEILDCLTFVYVLNVVFGTCEGLYLLEEFVM